ncbi:MAG: polyprenol monophosphomannose synthase [Geminicoccaceae bacterium]
MNSTCSKRQPKSVKKLTLIVPTLNEVDNILPLIGRLEAALGRTSWAAIIIDDDSEDGTYDVVQTIAAEKSHIKVVRRIGRRGLSSACIEAMTMATSPYVAVLDADLQHDEHLLRPMLEMIEGNQFDLVAASRFLPGGSIGPLSWQRALMSRTANLLCAKLCRVRLSDPMSGFFMMRRTLFHEVYSRLSGHGSKILLDIVTAARRPLNCAELPLRFRQRLSGESKLDAQVMWDFLYLLGQKTLARTMPAERDRPVARF